MSWTIGTAERLARAVHKGQVDKAGVEYIGHPEWVANWVAAQGGSKEQVMAAWLHDAVEDSDLTIQDLWDFGAPARTIKIIDAVSKRPEESTEEYYTRLHKTLGAQLVKVGDREHNVSRLEALAEIDPEKAAKLTKKYEKTGRLLGLS